MAASARALSLVALLIPFLAAGAPLLTPAQYTERYAAAARRAAPDASVRVAGALTVVIRRPGGAVDEAQANLDNAYELYQRDPSRLDGIIGDQVKSMLEAFARTDAPVAKESIVPVLKTRTWLEETQRYLKQRSGGKGAGPEVWDPYEGELVVVYAVDTPSSIAFLGRADLEKAGLSKARLRAIAPGNLLAHLPEIEVRGEGRLMVLADGNYEASLLLVDAFWESGRVKVDGDPVVAIPARDVLLVCGSNDLASVRELRRWAKKAIGEMTYPLSSELWVRRGGRFTRLRE